MNRKIERSIADYPYEEIDKRVRELFFPNDLPRQWAFNRNLAACVLEKIMFHENPEVRRRFNQTIERWYDEKRDIGIERGWDFFMLWATPDVICRAAIDAVERTSIPKP
jgi:hypothetical protein